MPTSKDSIELHQILERAIHKKLGTVDHEDDVVIWESGVRASALQVLRRLADEQSEVADLLHTITTLEQNPDSANLTDLLAQLLSALEGAQQLSTDAPHALLCWSLARPRMTARALVFADQVDVQALGGDERVLFQLARLELWVNSGSLQRALEALGDMDVAGIDDPLVASLFQERASRIYWARNSAKALALLNDGIERLEAHLQFKPAGPREWRMKVQMYRARALMLMHLDRNRSAQESVDASVSCARTWLEVSSDDVKAQIALARSLRLSGDLLKQASRIVSSFRAYRESRQIIEALIKRLPNDPDLQAELPARHEVVGDLYFEKLELTQAWSAYQDCLAQTVNLAERDPDNVRWRREKVLTTLKMAGVLKHQYEHVKALTWLENAWREVEALLNRDPHSLGFQTLAIEVCEFAGRLEYDRHFHASARAWFERAWNMLQTCLQADTVASRWQAMQLALTLRASINDAALGEKSEASRELMRSRDLILQMLAEGRVNARLLSYLATFYKMMSVEMQHRGRMKDALSLMESSYQTVLHCVAQFSDSVAWQVMTASIELQLVQALRLNGKKQEATAMQDKAAKSFQKLSRAHLQDAEIYGQWLLASLQSLDMEEDASPLHEQHLLRLLKQIRRHSEKFPGHLMLTSDLQMATLGSLVDLYLSRQDMGMARHWLSERMALAARMEESCPASIVIEMQQVSVLTQTARLALQDGRAKDAVISASEGLERIEKYRRGEYHIAADAVPTGQLLLLLVTAFEAMGQDSKAARVIVQARRLAQWLRSTGTEHPAHLSLAFAIERLA